MKHITASIISKPKDTLNPELFDTDNEFKQSARLQILAEIKKLKSELRLRIKRLWVVGSGITYQYADKSDIDINVLLSDKASNDELKTINSFLNEHYNGNIILGQYPVNFHVCFGPYSLSKSEAIYDLYNNHWIKKPKRLSENEIKQMIDSCVPNELLDKLINQYLNLEKLYNQYYESENKASVLKEFEDKISMFMISYEDLKKARRDAPIRDCIAIVYKIAESFGISELYKKFKKIYR